jgi:hypothetical protein
MKYNYSFFYLFLVIALLSFGSCNLYNPAEPVPAYISIQQINLTTTSIQGTNSNRITDAWVYIDEQLVGCYELPTTFPVISEGTHQIRISAGIKINGISASRGPYPFYTQYTQVVNLQKGTTTPITPTVAYAAYAHFDFMEDFEGSGIAIDSSAGTDTLMQRIYSPNPNVFNDNGHSSGIAYLDHKNTFFECVSSLSYTLPKSGSDVFLEFNYKANHPFIVGVISQPPYYQKIASLTFNPTDGWRKTYLYLTPAISSSQNATEFKIFFGMINDTNSDSLALVLDNIKLVHH